MPSIWGLNTNIERLTTITIPPNDQKPKAHHDGGYYLDVTNPAPDIDAIPDHSKTLSHHSGFYFFISDSATPPVAHFEVKLQEAKESVFLSTRANNPLPADLDVNKLFHVYEAHYGKNPTLLLLSIDFVPSDDYWAMWEFGCDCHADCTSHRSGTPDLEAASRATRSSSGFDVDSQLVSRSRNVNLQVNNSENPYDPLENESSLIVIEVNMKDRLGSNEPHWEHLTEFITKSVINTLCSTFWSSDSKYGNGTHGDLDLKFMVGERVEPEVCGDIPRDVLIAVYEICKERVEIGESVHRVNVKFHASRADQVRKAVNLGNVLSENSAATVEEVD
ncbi:hypothetical protein DL95DRAFT_507553 [Leptodontidium sp. 2 PMI_412]|nr:hypothetical protein DL95DRAFT_507553 [Leptodontidium sp. 2 PMI_412]